MLALNVVTLFPEWFAGPLASSILGRAAQQGLVRYRIVQLRDFTHDRHHTVDDSPYGGGAGMVLKPEPFFEAVESLGVRKGSPLVLLSARGRPFTARRRGAVRGGRGSDAAVRPLQGRRPARRRA
jgi:tRNA (guanine37-N1)-methyltransferase